MHLPPHHREPPDSNRDKRSYQREALGIQQHPAQTMVTNLHQPPRHPLALDIQQHPALASRPNLRQTPLRLAASCPKDRPSRLDRASQRQAELQPLPEQHHLERYWPALDSRPVSARPNIQRALVPPESATAAQP